MRRHSAFGFFVFFAAALFVGCGGGGAGNSSALPSHGGSAGAMQQSAFRIFIPQPPTASLARAPQYVSANTKSVGITLTSVNGAPPSPTIPSTIFNTTVPPCTAVTGGISCIVTVGAILGSDVFTIVAYDAANGAGNVLSSGSVTIAVGPGTNTPPPVALGGNVVTVVVTPPPGATPLPNGDLSPIIDGTVNSIQVTVAAKDADGNLIVGSAPFASPIPIVATGDPNGALTFSPTSILAPNQNVVTLGTTGKLFYPTPSSTNPSPTLATASITFGPTGTNGTTFTIDPLQYDLPSGGLGAILPAPSTTTLGLQQAGATSFTIGAAFSATTSTLSPFSGGCGASLTGGGPTALPITCSTTSGSVELSLLSLVGGSGNINITTSIGETDGLPFTSLGSQGGSGATLGYTVVLWNMPNVGSAPNQDIPTSMALGPSGQHLWVAATNALSGGSVTYMPAQPLGSCTAFSSPCNITGAGRETLPAATPGPTYTPIPAGLTVGGDGHLWYADLGTNALSNPTLADFSASQCDAAGITACTLALPPSLLYGPGVPVSGYAFSASADTLAADGAGNLYILFGGSSGGAVSAISFSGSFGILTTKRGPVQNLLPGFRRYIPTAAALIPTPETLAMLSGAPSSALAGGIALGSDGRMWLSVSDPTGNSSQIVALSSCTTTATFSCSTVNTYQENEASATGPYRPGEIVSVPSTQKLWFINFGGATSGYPTTVAPFIESISTAGGFAPRIPIPNAASVSGTIALGPDGNIWFPITTATGTQQICRYTIVTNASGPSFYCVTIPPIAGTSYPAGPMAIGPDGNLWFGLVGAPYVGEVIP